MHEIDADLYEPLAELLHELVRTLEKFAANTRRLHEIGETCSVLVTPERVAGRVSDGSVE